MNRFVSQKETVLKGLPVSEGYAVARVCLFNEKRHSNLPIYRVEGAGIERELAKVKRAIAVVGERLEAIRKEVAESVGRAEAEIFVAQKAILEDPTLFGQIEAVIKEQALNAETAITRVLDEFEARLQQLDNAYIRERASDFGEIKRRLLDVLGNMRPDLQCSDQHHCQRGKNRIVVAEEMTPTLTTELDTRHLMGLVTERGGYNSHGAILARALGIPAVSGVRGIHSSISCGTEILVNGTTGEVVIWPSEETVTRTALAFPEAMREPQPVDPVEGLRVMANIRLAADVDEAGRMKAEGIGLYRTEVELMQSGRLLSEDELYDNYLYVFRAMAGKPVVFRLYDLGSDKKPAFLNIPAEENPALGWRGARLLLGSPDLWKNQARALAKVSTHGTVLVMYPMVTDVEQFRKLRSAFENAIAGQPRGAILHGLMFEVPSACLDAERMFREADFASIGTNDLMQYLYAVDRSNEMVAADFDYDGPVFWRIMRQVAAAANGAGKSLSVCGEIAGDPRYVLRLMETGITTFSVSARRIPVVRTVVKEQKKAQNALAKQKYLS